MLCRPSIQAVPAQSEGAWFIRGTPGIREAYAAIWKKRELIVSMDCVIAWRPWWAGYLPRWLPRTEGLHLDQNPFSKPTLESVQGMVPLYAVDEGTGGLEVVPFTHTEKSREAIKGRYPRWKTGGDWCPLQFGLPKTGLDVPKESKPLLLLAEAGDLVLWDSRLVHGGKVGSRKVGRLSAAACLVRPGLSSRRRRQAALCLTDLSGSP